MAWTDHPSIHTDTTSLYFIFFLTHSAVTELRKQYKVEFEKKHGVKLSFMSPFICASAYALKHQPVVNAVIEDDGENIIYRDYVDISVAVATPKVRDFFYCYI